MLMHMCAMALMHLTNTVCAHCLWFEDELKKRSMSMFKPPGASVPSWKISRCSSRSRVAVSPFTCLTTDTRMSWTWLRSGRLKCSAMANPPYWKRGFCLKPSTELGCSLKRSKSLRPVLPMYSLLFGRQRSLHYSIVTAGPWEQEISALQSGPGILQSLHLYSRLFLFRMRKSCKNAQFYFV